MSRFDLRPLKSMERELFLEYLVGSRCLKRVHQDSAQYPP